MQAFTPTPFLDPPKVLLAEAAKRLRVPVSASSVHGLVQAHPDENSAPALTEAAQKIGVQVVVGDIEFDGLDLHDVRERGQQLGLCGRLGGFALFEGRARDGYRLWDSIQGSHILAEDEFRSVWDGRVLIMKRSADEKALRETLFQRIKYGMEFADWTRLRLAASPVAPYLFAVLCMLLASACVVAAIRTSRWWLIGGMAALGLVAWIAEYLLLRMHYSDFTRALDYCGGENSGCGNLLRSDQAMLAGLPLAGIGWSFHAATLAALCFGGPGAWAVVGGVCALGLLPALYLVRVQIAKREFCRFCNAIHMCNLAATVLFAIGMSGGMPALEGLLEPSLVFVAVFLLALTGVVPHLMTADDFRRLQIAEEKYEMSTAHAIDVLLQSPKFELPRPFGVPMYGRGAPLRALIIGDVTCSKCIHTIRDAMAMEKNLKSYIDLWVMPFANSIGVEDDPDYLRLKGVAATLLGIGLIKGPRALVGAYTIVHREWDNRARSDDFADYLLEYAKVQDPKYNAHFAEAAEQGEQLKQLMPTLNPNWQFPLLWIEGRVVVKSNLDVISNVPTLVSNYPDFGQALFGKPVALQEQPASSPTGIDMLSVSAHASNTVPQRTE